MIYGERIRLRSIERSDLPLFVNWLNDPEVIEGLQMVQPLSMIDEEAWFEGMSRRPKDEHPYVIEVKRDDGWMPVGNCGFFNIDWRCRSAEIGIFIGHKQIWGSGYGTDALRTLLRFGFETLNLNRIMLEVYETNRRAIRAYEKAGFVLEGRKRQAMYKHGHYLDILLMSVLRQEWPGGDA